MPHINSSRVTQYQAQTQLVSLFSENPLIFLFILGHGAWGIGHGGDGDIASQREKGKG